MAPHINPGNEGFARMLRSEYVDKTGLIARMNETMDTANAFVAVTRPRRFGKSFAARSLVAYYDRSCDSRALFDGLAISRDASFDRYLNAYNVAWLDMTEFTGTVGADVTAEVTRVLVDELREMVPDAGRSSAGRPNELTSTLLDAVDATGSKFVFVIDEWDAPFRDATHDERAQRRYVDLLRLLFKNGTFTDACVAAAYLTGILPIKRYGTQSALTDFNEYTMLDPAGYAPYVGFTEAEAEALAGAHGLDMAQLQSWYDGYELPGAGHVYAPFSVMRACQRGKVGPYWTSSETFSMLRFYIDLDFDGLQQAVVQVLGGARVPVDTGTFNNDMREVGSRDDALTLLVHLGYLAYDEAARSVHIPNDEVRAELTRALRESRHAMLRRCLNGGATRR